MPSRRSVLATSGLTASAALSGCTMITGPPGTAATISGGVLDISDVKSAPVVARAETKSDGNECPNGAVYMEATLFEKSSANNQTRLVLLTKYNVITGDSGCSTNWRQAGIAVQHNWRTEDLSNDGVCTNWQSNVVPANNDDQKQATVEQKHSTETADWRIHLTPPTTSSGTYQFISEFVNPGRLTAGDILVETQAKTQVTQGWFGGDDVLKTTATMTYGDTDG